MPNATAEQEEYSREFQLLHWMPGMSRLPCRSAVWKGRSGGVFCKGSEGESLRKYRQWLQCNCAGNLVSNIRGD